MKKEFDEAWARDVEAHFREATQIAAMENHAAQALRDVSDFLRKHSASGVVPGPIEELRKSA
jgi:hypothetical protein